jgi:hypothetical protein
MNELKLILERFFDTSFNGVEFEGYLLKKITLGSSISVQKPSHGYHIEFTDTHGPMTFFPVVTNSNYLETKKGADKRRYGIKIPLKIQKSNLLSLLNSVSSRKENNNLKLPEDGINDRITTYGNSNEVIDSFAVVSFSIRGTGQMQTELGTSSDHPSFVDLRNVILPNEYLLFLREQNSFQYWVFGIPKFEDVPGLADYFATNPEFKQEPSNVNIDADLFVSDTESDEETSNKSSQIGVMASNKIYFGAPGTGKSHAVDQIVKSLDVKYWERITFHPEFDYASFVGGYKPSSEKTKVSVEDGEKEEYRDNIKYKFMPQTFTNIYARAWENVGQNEHFYLVIEEINRGNCAEIFGDVFQLLDRESSYTVTPSEELKDYLIERLGKDHEGVKKGLKLPKNLSILATMNTSDQSLFPMDSAFKRRWDWKYVPINYEKEYVDEKGRKTDNKSVGYVIAEAEHDLFGWVDFIKTVNSIIKNNPNLGMDKCVGNFFVKPANDSTTVSLEMFINKVIFYLWNDVFKDEEESENIFPKGIFYEDFFPIKTNGLVQVKAVIEKINRIAEIEAYITIATKY